ncbi:hypothetical protein BC831DRAFT_438324 [Entophlyctis helioformis]|nr:hypothetical protein BC831DRAFT_438324 [Entophlyctis helioformis]
MAGWRWTVLVFVGKSKPKAARCTSATLPAATQAAMGDSSSSNHDDTNKSSDTNNKSSDTSNKSSSNKRRSKSSTSSTSSDKDSAAWRAFMAAHSLSFRTALRGLPWPHILAALGAAYKAQSKVQAQSKVLSLPAVSHLSHACLTRVSHLSHAPLLQPTATQPRDVETCDACDACDATVPALSHAPDPGLARFHRVPVDPVPDPRWGLPPVQPPVQPPVHGPALPSLSAYYEAHCNTASFLHLLAAPLSPSQVSHNWPLQEPPSVPSASLPDHQPAFPSPSTDAMISHLLDSLNDPVSASHAATSHERSAQPSPELPRPATNASSSASSASTPAASLTRAQSYDNVSKIASLDKSPSSRFEAFLDEIFFADMTASTQHVPGDDADHCPSGPCGSL